MVMTGAIRRAELKQAITRRSKQTTTTTMCKLSTAGRLSLAGAVARNIAGMNSLVLVLKGKGMATNGRTRLVRDMKVVMKRRSRHDGCGLGASGKRRSGLNASSEAKIGISLRTGMYASLLFRFVHAKQSLTSTDVRI